MEIFRTHTEAVEIGIFRAGKIVVEDVSKAASPSARNKNDGKPERGPSFDVSTLLNREKFRAVAILTGNDISDFPELYAVRLENRGGFRESLRMNRSEEIRHCFMSVKRRRV